jgi:hypothetical protein
MNPPPAPWHHTGVNFRCKGPECGDCCSGKNGPGAVWVELTEIEALARHLGLSLADFASRFVRRLGAHLSLVEKPNHDCVFYTKERGCTVYEARPGQCRTYPFWARILRTRADWDAEAPRCPGIGPEAPLVPGAEVRRALDDDARRFPDGRPEAP